MQKKKSQILDDFSRINTVTSFGLSSSLHKERKRNRAQRLQPIFLGIPFPVIPTFRRLRQPNSDDIRTAPHCQMTGNKYALPWISTRYRLMSHPYRRPETTIPGSEAGRLARGAS